MTTKRDHHEELDGPSLLVHVKGLEGRVDGIERSVDVLGKRFDRSLSSVNEKLETLTRTIAANPGFRIGETLDIVLKCAILLGMAATSIIWIATSNSAGASASMQTQMQSDRWRLERIERVLDRMGENKVAAK